MNVKTTTQEALDYHEFPNPGKIGTSTTVPFESQKDLSLAYSPGVAEPCLEIQKNPDDAYRYTSKANLVAVISNGTAVLGLGDIGSLASKPVMEGKAVLFKNFAAVDSFDIEVDETNVDKFCEVVEKIANTFGGINLEDIKAPECFEIEKRLIESLDIPIMHDDQHGTAIISCAGMINACELLNKKIEDLKVVVVGAGASAISCARMYKELGVKDIIMLDSKGVVSLDRDDINIYKKEFAIKQHIDMNEAFKDADMVLGLSGPNSFNVSHVELMVDEPIIFTMANPTPEIFPEDVYKVRPNAIVGTGRSDYANQVNNVLGFPYIFRGALDVHAKKITMNMKLAAAYALANLAKQPVPKDVCEVYGDENLSFSKQYVIPKPFDKRLIVEVSSAVAKAAVEDNVARVKDYDHDAYKEKLKKMI
jgi:malate dehydrogenase (oxaloacetate-decarboxylating)/malate dehydrogenase (oxaloacetate-decarboxylating)(NADP+)